MPFALLTKIWLALLVLTGITVGVTSFDFGYLNVLVAMTVAGEAATTLVSGSHAVHGAIGITAEYPVGHYVSRLTAIEHTWGGSDDHLRRLSANVGNYSQVDL